MIELPLRIVSTANLREHWRTKAARAKAQRSTAFMVLAQRYVWPYPYPCEVTLTRVAPRALDDDNLANAFKSVRDGVADAMGIKDNDPRVVWKYAQVRGKAKEYAARVDIKAA